MEIISETDYHIVTHLEGHYVKVDYKSKELPLEDYLKVIEVGKNLCKIHGKIYIIYFQARNFSIEKETWSYMKKNAYKYNFIGANALIVTDLAQRLMTKIYMFFSKDKTPTKVFSDPDKAMEWLKEKGSETSVLSSIAEEPVNMD